MYCPKCASPVNQSLNFCNVCGAKLAKGETAGDRPVNPISYLIAALCVIGGSGLGLLVALIAILLDKNVDEAVLVVISGLYLTVLLATNIMLIRQISKLIDHQARANQTETKKEGWNDQPSELRVATNPLLESPRQRPIGSVTEHTTRTLDDEIVYKER